MVSASNEAPSCFNPLLYRGLFGPVKFLTAPKKSYKVSIRCCIAAFSDLPHFGLLGRKHLAGVKR